MNVEKRYKLFRSVKGVCLTAVILTFSGCASIGYRSNQEMPDLTRSGMKAKFKISELNVSSPELNIAYNGEITQVCQFLSDSEEIQKIAEKKFPELFSSRRSSLPVSLKIKIDYEYNSGRFIGAFFSGLTWGLIPMALESDHGMDIAVTIDDKMSAILVEKKGRLLVERNGWESLPLFTALIDSPYSSDIPEETLIMSPMAEVLVTEQGMQFFREKVVEQIVYLIMNMDSDKLNKAYIIRSNKQMLLSE